MRRPGPRGHLRVLPGGGGAREIPHSLAGRPDVPQQVAQASGGLLAYGAGYVAGFLLFGAVRVACEAHAAWEAWRKRGRRP